MTRYDAIVVGGGIAGLAAAYELTRAGLRPLVLEARGYVGGLIAGATLADVPIDIGAEAWAVRRPEVGELVEELGLTVQAPGGASWVYGADGRAVRMPARAMLGIPQQPADRDVVEALGPVDAARASRDMTMAMSDDDARRLGSGDLAALVSERMGGATLEKLVRPVACFFSRSTSPFRAPIDNALRIETMIRSGLAGLMKKSLAPACMAWTTVSMPPVAVSTITG